MPSPLEWHKWIREGKHFSCAYCTVPQVLGMARAKGFPLVCVVPLLKLNRKSRAERSCSARTAASAPSVLSAATLCLLVGTAVLRDACRPVTGRCCHRVFLLRHCRSLAGPARVRQCLRGGAPTAGIGASRLRPPSLRLHSPCILRESSETAPDSPQGSSRGSQTPSEIWGGRGWGWRACGETEN